MAFQKKTQQLDWSLFLSLNVDALQKVLLKTKNSLILFKR